jgi:hypothetical protein
METSTAGQDTDNADRPRPRRRRLLLIGGVLAVLVLGVVLVWFQPQTLLFDRVVEDEFPTAAAGAAADDDTAGATDATPDETPDEAADTGADAADTGDDEADTGDDAADGAASEAGEDADGAEASPPAGPVALGQGSFSSRNRYTVVGTATVYELEDGTRTLRLEGFESTNGPDLFVYLSAADEADTDAALDADAVDLGVLRGNIGDQNYAIPDDVDLERYDTVVIWCRRFSTSFGAADLA